jgi:hypothetical protein
MIPLQFIMLWLAGRRVTLLWYNRATDVDSRGQPGKAMDIRRARL